MMPKLPVGRIRQSEAGRLPSMAAPQPLRRARAKWALLLLCLGLVRIALPVSVDDAIRSPSMTSPLRFAARYLPACSLIACLCAAGPTALGQTAPVGLDPAPQTNVGGASLAERGGRVYRSCTRVFDGRGEKVLAGPIGGAAGNTANCPTTHPPTPPAPVNKPAELHDQPKPAAERQVRTVAPTPPPPAITAGHAVADPRENDIDTPIAPHISAGRLSATLVTGGTAVFLLQSGLWTYLLLLGLPLWRHVDLLPIVATAAHDADTGVDTVDDAGDDTAVTDVLDARSTPRDEARENG